MADLDGGKRTVQNERALIVGLVRPGREDDEEESLEELSRLAQSAGAQVVTSVVQKRPRPDPGSYLGRGKTAELAERAQELDVDVVIVDDDLTPAQVRRLETLTKRKVIDRSELILDIFASRARTRQAQLQVELAQLEYTLPRLTGMWTHLSRIKGGIGMRGPGEKQLEVDRRVAERRIHDLKKKLEEIGARQAREVEKRAEGFLVSLVGYTNAGKSTLLKALTGRDPGLIEDRPFTTLDTRTTKWPVSRLRPVFLSDTVGFIRKLPHHLVASFRATLEAARHAHLLLHVVDVSDPNYARQVDAVDQVLREVQIGGIPVVMVFNKADLAGGLMAEVPVIERRWPGSVFTAALEGTGLDGLAALVRARAEEGAEEVALLAPYDRPGIPAFVKTRAEVLDEAYGERGVRMRIRILPASLAAVRGRGALVLNSES